MFYLIFKNIDQRTRFINYSRKNKVLSVFHYLSLHKSPYYLKNKKDSSLLKYSDIYTDSLVRLPLFFDITDNEVEKVIEVVLSFFNE